MGGFAIEEEIVAMVEVKETEHDEVGIEAIYNGGMVAVFFWMLANVLKQFVFPFANFIASGE